MTYQHCPRCRLAIRCRAGYMMLANCPRCLARAAIASPLFASPLDGLALRATSSSVPQRTTTPAAGEDPRHARSRS